MNDDLLKHSQTVSETILGARTVASPDLRRWEMPVGNLGIQSNPIGTLIIGPLLFYRSSDLPLLFRRNNKGDPYYFTTMHPVLRTLFYHPGTCLLYCTVQCMLSVHCSLYSVCTIVCTVYLKSRLEVCVHASAICSKPFFSSRFLFQPSYDAPLAFRKSKLSFLVVLNRP